MKITEFFNREQYKWVAFVLLVVVLSAIIVVRFSNTPTTTRADNRSVANEFEFVPSQQQRDLSTPSSRLVGHWKNVDYYCEQYFSQIDSALRIGTNRVKNKPNGRLGLPFRFKILFENPSGTQLVVRPYGRNEVLRAASEQIEMELWMSDVTYTIPKHGQSMTEEYTVGESQVFAVYHYVDNKTDP